MGPQSTTIIPDRNWLLTWTTYGTWLPGDERGFVSNVDDGASAKQVRHNIPGTPYDKDMADLMTAATARTVGDPVRLNKRQAEALLLQFNETANYRGWLLRAIAIMTHHCHIVAGVVGDPEPGGLLRDFKSYGSRALSRLSEKPESGRWWTESGSKRKLPDDDAILASIRYVAAQEFPLVVWTQPVPELGFMGGRVV